MAANLNAALPTYSFAVTRRQFGWVFVYIVLACACLMRLCVDPLSVGWNGIYVPVSNVLYGGYEWNITYTAQPGNVLSSTFPPGSGAAAAMVVTLGTCLCVFLRVRLINIPSCCFM